MTMNLNYISHLMLLLPIPRTKRISEKTQLNDLSLLYFPEYIYQGSVFEPFISLFHLFVDGNIFS